MNKRAFTLVELLVVVGIMASMATLSIGSYFAVVRGMSDRSAISVATSAIMLAQERACIDMVPTVVYFYNEVVDAGNVEDGEDPVVAGVVIAVRRAGRITRVAGKLIGDEFADLDRTYGAIENENDLKDGDTFRLYKFNVNKMEYSSVFSTVVEDSIPCDENQYIVNAPTTLDVGLFKKNRDYNLNGNETPEDRKYLLSYSFKIPDGGDGDASWKVGDAYGYEFVRVRLPDNYIFGSGSGDAPSRSDRVKIPSSEKPIHLDPAIGISDTTLADTVNIATRRANGQWRKVGKSKTKIEDI